MRRALAVLLFVELLGLRLFLHRTGFYHDDWIFLEMFTRAGGFWAAAAEFARRGHWLRPLQVLQLPAFYQAAWPWPPAGQLILAALEVAEGTLLFLLWRRLFGNARLALAAAAFALLYPNRDVVHFWLSNGSQLVAHVCVLASLLWQLDWASSGRRSRLAAAQGAFLLGLSAYESAAFLPLVLAGARPAKGRAGWRLLAPYALTLAAFVLWQRWGVKLLFGIDNPKSMALSPVHFARVYAAGFECVTNRALHNAWKAAEPFFKGFPWPLLALWALGAGAVGSLATEGEEPAGRPGRPVWYAMGCLFVGAYLPYALSTGYVPVSSGLLSRVNGAGAWVGGLLLAAGLEAARSAWGRRWARGLAVLAAALFLMADWRAALAWATSWDLQKSVVAGVSRRMEGIADPATVLVRGVPNYLGPAVVFDSHYDLDSAVRVSTRRWGLHATMLGPRIHFTQDGVEERIGDALMRAYPKENLYLYDYSDDSLKTVRVDGRGGAVFKPL